MIKVMIADDEERIIRLIRFLVDWESLGMEVVAVAGNGLQALELMKEHRPDIVITDIKMPGCDGLRMIEISQELLPNVKYIVISGYKQFDYARRAIQYGVSNYLLKPIDQEELVQTLEKLKGQLESFEKQKSSGQRLEEFEQLNIKRARKKFIELLVQKEQLREKINSISQINQDYHFLFAEGVFQTVAIKVDGQHDQTDENQRYLESKISGQLSKHLTGCYDWEYLVWKGIYFVVMNYNPAVIDGRERMNDILHELLLQQFIIEHFHLTIGMGIQDNSVDVFRKGFKIAKWAIDQRLLLGTNKVIQGEDKNANSLVDTDIFRDFNSSFVAAIELQDMTAVINSINQLEFCLLNRQETTGYEIYQMTKEAVNAFQFTLRKLGVPFSDMEQLLERFNEEIHNCGSASEAFSYLRRIIRKSFEQMKKEKETLDSKPIREAKTYINEHLSEPISLDMVSDVVGFNTAYFSTLFKKETGSTFSDYLLINRLEQAKRLLRETKCPVAEVCTRVGYNDTKHFTKKFAKYTSLKPNEYRKLYS